MRYMNDECPLCRKSRDSVIICHLDITKSNVGFILEGALDREDELAEDTHNICAECFFSKPIVFYSPCGHNQVCISCVKQLQAKTTKCQECKALVKSAFIPAISSS